MKKRTFTQRDYIKANRRAARLAEIENHTRPVSIAGVHKSKKVYDRKRGKAEMKKALPYLFLEGLCEWLQNQLHFSNTTLSTPFRDYSPFQNTIYTLSGIPIVNNSYFIPERL